MMISPIPAMPAEYTDNENVSMRTVPIDIRNNDLEPVHAILKDTADIFAAMADH